MDNWCFITNANNSFGYGKTRRTNSISNAQYFDIHDSLTSREQLLYALFLFDASNATVVKICLVTEIYSPQPLDTEMKVIL